MVCIFHSLGIVLLFRDIKKRWHRGLAREAAQFLSTRGPMLSGPEALLGWREHKAW